MQAIRKLKQRLSQINVRGDISSDDVISICLRIRQLMDSNKQFKQNYPIVKLFCNWVVHDKLEDSKTIYNLLLEISIALSKAANLTEGLDPVEATKIVVQKGQNILQIPLLRQGIRTILEAEGLDTFLVNQKQAWEAFVILLIKELAEKPLQFPDELIKGQTTKKREAQKIWGIIRNLPDSRNHDKLHRLEITEKTNKPYVKLTALSGCSFWFEIGGREPIEDFFN